MRGAPVRVAAAAKADDLSCGIGGILNNPATQAKLSGGTSRNAKDNTMWFRAGVAA
jgi:hypothetical protein